MTNSTMVNEDQTAALVSLQDFPAVMEARDKLNWFASEREHAMAEVSRLEQLAMDTSKGKVNGATDHIAAAEALLGASALPDVSRDLAFAREKVTALTRALTAQHQVLDGAERAASRDASRLMRGRHVEITKQIMSAVQALRDANASESALRLDMERLGFSCTLPCMTYGAGVGVTFDIDDAFGGYAPGWWREASDYVQGYTPEERLAEECRVEADKRAEVERAKRLREEEAAGHRRQAEEQERARAVAMSAALNSNGGRGFVFRA